MSTATAVPEAPVVEPEAPAIEEEVTTTKVTVTKKPKSKKKIKKEAKKKAEKKAKKQKSLWGKTKRAAKSTKKSVVKTAKKTGKVTKKGAKKTAAKTKSASKSVAKSTKKTGKKAAKKTKAAATVVARSTKKVAKKTWSLTKKGGVYCVRALGYVGRAIFGSVFWVLSFFVQGVLLLLGGAITLVTLLFGGLAVGLATAGFFTKKYVVGSFRWLSTNHKVSYMEFLNKKYGTLKSHVDSFTDEAIVVTTAEVNENGEVEVVDEVVIDDGVQPDVTFEEDGTIKSSFVDPKDSPYYHEVERIAPSIEWEETVGPVSSKTHPEDDRNRNFMSHVEEMAEDHEAFDEDISSMSEYFRDFMNTIPGSSYSYAYLVDYSTTDDLEMLAEFYENQRNSAYAAGEKPLWSYWGARYETLRVVVERPRLLDEEPAAWALIHNRLKVQTQVVSRKFTRAGFKDEFASFQRRSLRHTEGLNESIGRS